jgi:beta-lactamase regulating signal transducer with metallopeptidase domain
LRHVFLHELAHLKRHDIALNWLFAGAQALHWFNPLVWLAFQQARRHGTGVTSWWRARLQDHESGD